MTLQFLVQLEEENKAHNKNSKELNGEKIINFVNNMRNCFFNIIINNSKNNLSNRIKMSTKDNKYCR